MKHLNALLIPVIILAAADASAQSFGAQTDQNFRRLDAFRFSHISQNRGKRAADREFAAKLINQDRNKIFSDTFWSIALNSASVGNPTWPDAGGSGGGTITYSKSPEGLFGTLEADGTPRQDIASGEVKNLSDQIHALNLSLSEAWSRANGDPTTSTTSAHGDYQLNSDRDDIQGVWNLDYSAGSNRSTTYATSINGATQVILPNVLFIGTIGYSKTSGNSMDSQTMTGDIFAGTSVNDNLVLFTDYSFPSRNGGSNNWEVGTKWILHTEKKALPNGLMTTIDKVSFKAAFATGSLYTFELGYRF